MISPTGRNTIRMDQHGSGKYGASRGSRLHTGVDYVCTPGEGVISPISGEVIRKVRPYRDALEYSGIVIMGADLTVKMYYLDPDVCVGETVTQGDVIGTAQDIGEKYGPEMIPHIHLEITSINPDIFISRIG